MSKPKIRAHVQQRTPLAFEDLPEFKRQQFHEENGGFWVGFEIDGTLARYHADAGPGSVGEVIDPLADRLFEHIKMGTAVRIFTSRIFPVLSVSMIGEMMTMNQNQSEINRAKLNIAAIRAFCVKMIGIPLPITCVKDHTCIGIYDRQAIQVKQNEGVPLYDFLLPNFKIEETADAGAEA